MGLFLKEIQENIKLDKVDKIIIALVFIIGAVLSPVFAAEDVSFSVVNGLNIRENANYFQSSSNNVGYFEIEKGYIYHIHNTASGDKRLAVSNEIPVLNGTYEFLVLLGAGETYDYIVTNNNNYIYFDFYSSTNVEITREKMTSMDGTVSDLVDNVGVSAIWDIFNTGINYIYVVVIAVIGLLFVKRMVTNLSKGKSRI